MSGQSKSRPRYQTKSRPYRVKAKVVLMAGGQWINKYVLRDKPESPEAAMNEFHHGPILTVNVAVRHWRYLGNIGISCARWFDREGFGWYTRLLAPMVIDGNHMPIDPGKPTILTFYIPFTSTVSQTGLLLPEQSLAARHVLFALSYAEIERRIREQMTEMFCGDFVIWRKVSMRRRFDRLDAPCNY